MVSSMPWIIVSFWIGLSISSQVLAQTLLLRNGQLIHSESREITWGHVLIQVDTVLEVSEQLPESFEGEVVDLEGKYILPALYDLHTHSWGNMAPGGLADVLSTDGTAKRMLYAGVAGFLDLFSPEEYILDLRDQQRLDSDQVLGADIFCAGPIFTCTGGHGTEYGVPTRIINSPEDAFREMKELAPHKPDVIKIMYNRNPEYLPSMDKATMEAIIQAAHQYGFKSVSHINTWEDIADVVEAGIDGFTHTPIGRGPEELIQKIKDKGIVYIPTLSVHMGLLTLLEDTAWLNDPLLTASTLEGVINAYKDSSKFMFRDKAWIEYQKRNKDSVIAAFNQLVNSGVIVLTGTDSGNLGTFQGYSLHMELHLMHEAGMDIEGILKASTQDAPSWLGIKTGFQTGAKANFLILENSPLGSLNNLKKIYRILQNGRWVDRSSLLN